MNNFNFNQAKNKQYHKEIDSYKIGKFILDNNIFKPISYYQNLQTKKKCEYKPPSFISNNENRPIIVLGDLHGELYALLQALYKSKVINLNGEWIGQDTIVVQVGDQIDKGGRGIDINNDDMLEELKIIEFLHNLHFKAIKYNGGVYNLIGNHELMNILGDFRYVTDNHLNKGFKGELIRKELFEPGGALAQKLACNTNGILQINNWIFVHAGLLPEHIEKYSISEINDTIRQILLGNKMISELNSDIRELITENNGFLWNRLYSNGIDPERCSKLKKVLDIVKFRNYNKGGMVVGHTPKDTITSDCDNKLHMVDVSMSTAFGKKNNPDERIEILKIINNGEKIIKIT